MNVVFRDIADIAVHKSKVGIIAVCTRTLYRSAGAASGVLFDMALDMQHIHL